MLNVIDIDRWREWGSAGGEGGRDLKVEDVCGGAAPSGGEEATLGGLPPEKGRGNNGRIMDGRGPGVDGWR
jgi:hypothetical protein